MGDNPSDYETEPEFPFLDEDSGYDTDTQYPRRRRRPTRTLSRDEHTRRLHDAFLAMLNNRELTEEQRILVEDDFEQYRRYMDRQRGCARRACDSIANYIKDTFSNFRPYPFYRGGKRKKLVKKEKNSKKKSIKKRRKKIRKKTKKHRKN